MVCSAIPGSVQDLVCYAADGGGGDVKIVHLG